MFFTRFKACHIRLIAVFISAAFAFASQTAEAKSRLITVKDGVVAYSGPGDYYRPLAVFPAKTELAASSQIIRGKNGAYYKVLVKLSEKKSVIGYVNIQALATFVSDKLEDDDLSKYGDVALVNQAVQITYSILRDSASLWTVGYMKYLSPGFYVKGFAGQYISKQANASVAGGEVGNDALLFGRVSGLVSYDLGVFSPSTPGLIFEASSKINAMMQAGFGLRYNFGGLASMSGAITQAVFFNGNNSMVTSGALVTLEVGL